MKPQFEVLDISIDSSREAFDSLMRNYMQKPFAEDDILYKPLVRYQLFRNSCGNYLFMISCCHLLLDGMAIPSLFERIFARYQDGFSLESKDLYSGTLFDAYVFKNNESFDNSETIEYWKKALPETELLVPVADALHKKAGKYAVKKLAIETGHLDKIRLFCKKHKTNMAFYLKIIYVLLVDYYYKPQSPYVLYSNYHGRSKGEMNCLGLYFYPVPAVVNPTDYKGVDAFEHLFRVFKESERRSVRFRTISMEALNRIKRQHGANFIYNFFSPLHSAAPGGIGYLNPTDCNGNTRDIKLMVYCPNEENVELILSYHESFFEYNAFLDRALHVSNQVLEGVEPSMLDFCLPAEKELIMQFSRADLSFPVHQSYATLFEKQVGKTPDTIAVVYNNDTYTYRQINEKASRLAQYLTTHGHINKGDRVAVAMERSPLTVICIIALFKTGAVYLPLDIILPVERINYYIQDASPKLILVDKQAPHLLTHVQSEQLLLLDIDLSGMPETAYAIETNITGDDLAYIIYTSGTTGTPKGVMIEHKGMVNHLYEKIRELDLFSNLTVAQTAKTGFDISIWQFLAPLLAGGAVHIYSGSLIENVQLFIDRINRDGVQILEVVPSYLALMLETMTKECEGIFNELKYLLVTGDTLNKKYVERFFDLFPRICMVNAYGPTEASDDITHYKMFEDPAYTSIPLGKPVSNANLYIVDDHNRLCPIGMVGEIWVSGIVVGRGYWNKKELTAEAFIEDPFNGQQGCRLYKTGDLGCWLPDGNILFHGRKDNQVKINGNRLECSEIERAILDIKNVQEAVVLVKENAQDEKYLVACFKAAESVHAGEIESWLANRLPPYMVPGYFIRVEQWPLTENGKVDKKALLQLNEKEEKTTVEAPVGEMEEKLTAIWKEVLGLDSIGRKADFFDLGGHSLKAMQVVFKISQLLGVQIELRTIFDQSTIEKLAIAIELVQQPAEQAKTEVAVTAG